MPLERDDVRYALWRKKVDGSLLRHSVTPIPGWVGRMWSITSVFPNKGGRRDPESQVALRFKGARFNGAVTWYRRGASGVAYRLWFEDSLRYALAEAFVMSHMRDLEARLRAARRDSGDVEQEIPFWEFLDIEFDPTEKTFDLTAYYVQKPSFPELFRRLADAPPLKRIWDELAGKGAARIHKQKWKPRSEFETEIGATNVIYMLADTVNRLLYVGEADALIPRFRRGHELIPDWSYYRYSALPQSLAGHRLQLERMIIRDIDAVLGETATALPVTISDFKLVNLRIDR
jgi:hypothetical protein